MLTAADVDLLTAVGAAVAWFVLLVLAAVLPLKHR
jgi:hypothetical protein